MKGLLLAMGAPKEGADDDESDAPASEGSEESPERTYAREAYAALHEKDEAGFIEALLALKSCGGMKKAAPSEAPEAPEDDSDEE